MRRLSAYLDPLVFGMILGMIFVAITDGAPLSSTTATQIVTSDIRSSGAIVSSGTGVSGFLHLKQRMTLALCGR